MDGPLVNPGDLIMGDECGVVSVPEEIIDKVFKEAYKILDNENNILQDQLNDGKSFLDILKYRIIYIINLINHFII